MPHVPPACECHPSNWIVSKGTMRVSAEDRPCAVVSCSRCQVDVAWLPGTDERQAHLVKLIGRVKATVAQRAAPRARDPQADLPGPLRDKPPIPADMLRRVQLVEHFREQYQAEADSSYPFPLQISSLELEAARALLAEHTIERIQDLIAFVVADKPVMSGRGGWRGWSRAVKSLDALHDRWAQIDQQMRDAREEAARAAELSPAGALLAMVLDVRLRKREAALGLRLPLRPEEAQALNEVAAQQDTDRTKYAVWWAFQDAYWSQRVSGAVSLARAWRDIIAASAKTWTGLASMRPLWDDIVTESAVAI